MHGVMGADLLSTLKRDQGIRRIPYVKQHAISAFSIFIVDKKTSQVNHL